MGVYIKYMEMPHNCGECWIPCTVEFQDRNYLSRPKCCPCFEVKIPHGRLIDADAAAKRGWTISRTYSASPTEMVYEAKPMTDEVLPTIIEAEKGE